MNNTETMQEVNTTIDEALINDLYLENPEAMLEVNTTTDEALIEDLLNAVDDEVC